MIRTSPRREWRGGRAPLRGSVGQTETKVGGAVGAWGGGALRRRGGVACCWRHVRVLCCAGRRGRWWGGRNFQLSSSPPTNHPPPLPPPPARPVRITSQVLCLARTRGGDLITTPLVVLTNAIMQIAMVVPATTGLRRTDTRARC